MTAQGIDVGGSFKAQGEVKAKEIDVGGAFTTESRVDIQKLDVGGAAKVRGGRINEVDVGGVFESREELEFDTIMSAVLFFFLTRARATQ